MMMVEVNKSTLIDLEKMFEETRSISDFIEKHCSQKAKIIFGYDLKNEQIQTVPDDVVVLGTDCFDSIEAVRNAGRALSLNYLNHPINGIYCDDGTLWFDPEDFQYFLDPITHLMKDVEMARHKLEEMGGSDYVQTFGDGKTLISLDGLEELTSDDGWCAPEFCPWCESVIGVWIDTLEMENYTFSLS